VESRGCIVMNDTLLIVLRFVCMITINCHFIFVCNFDRRVLNELEDDISSMTGWNCTFDASRVCVTGLKETCCDCCLCGCASTQQHTCMSSSRCSVAMATSCSRERGACRVQRRKRQQRQVCLHWRAGGRQPHLQYTALRAEISCNQ
jgi:hypothetical protein